MNKILEFNNVSMHFCNGLDVIKVLDDISFSLNDNEIIALVGPSGSGKTTILNLISKIISPTLGNVLVSGDVGYMFQKDHLLEYYNIYNNVILPLKLKKVKDKSYYNEVERMFKHYGLENFKKYHPSQLSGGMRQRVALIRTLCPKPQILLLDEPFSALDFHTKIKVSTDIYKIIKEEKKAAIFVTHDIEEAISMADRVITLTERPSKIKNIYDIKFESKRDPLSVRKTKEFAIYFDKIWNDLYE